MVLEMCYKALYNALTRREHERSENRRMIEKQQRIESITLNMREQGATAEQLAEVSKFFCSVMYLWALMMINIVSCLTMFLNNITFSTFQSINFTLCFIDRRNADTTRTGTAGESSNND
jgi:hypothetical protein